jgi:hypothetical protein
MRAKLRSQAAFCLALLSSAVHTTTPAERLDWGSPLARLALPAALTAAEEADPALLTLARRFNPAMALPIREIWPVEVRYAWHDGAALLARIEHPGGRSEERPVFRGDELERRDWSELPTHTSAGRPIRYYIDAPGDDGLDEAGVSRWRRRFAEITGASDETKPVAESAYPPTQYVHVYWWNRDEGLLAMQYWFYYPFNEWVNHHEGDWEHIQVILRGPPHLADVARFRPVAYHYFFHDFWIEAKEVFRFAGAGSGDHALVYVGGRGEWFGYAGMLSGGSYPGPGLYPAAGFRPPVVEPGRGHVAAGALHRRRRL